MTKACGFYNLSADATARGWFNSQKVRDGKAVKFFAFGTRTLVLKKEKNCIGAFR